MSPSITKLKNGLTVVTDPMPHLETAAVGVWVNAGARHETEPTNGIREVCRICSSLGTWCRPYLHLMSECATRFDAQAHLPQIVFSGPRASRRPDRTE